MDSKISIYKVIIKPVWTYGMQIWGSASNSNVDILQRFQSKTLRTIANAPWYVTNEILHHDLGIQTVKEEIARYSTKYLSRLENHPNPHATNFLDSSQQIHRLKRHHILDLPHRSTK